MENVKTSFLHLPLEVRLQIYQLALSFSRLSIRAILDPEWLFAPDRGCQVASLIFASKQIYYEAAPIFYSKATLEITPCQRDPADARKLVEFAQQYEHDHAFCPAKYLQRIQNVHIYGDQAWPVDQDSYQALFQWLVAKTGVKSIYLSRKTMQQGRHIPEIVCLNNLEYDFAKQSKEIRIIDIYARNVSSRLRFWGTSLTNRTKPPPAFQLYMKGPDNCRQQLCREPQWDLMVGNVCDSISTEELLDREMKRFADEELGDAHLRQAHIDGYLWLYKTIHIRRNTNCTTRNVMPNDSTEDSTSAC